MTKSDVIYGNRWVAYFDMLGFKEKIKELKHKEAPLDSWVEVSYKGTLLNNFHEAIKVYQNDVSGGFFSDSFIFVSKSEDPNDFALMTCAKYFLAKQTWVDRPFTGAISYGQIYAEPENNIFVGPALIDAHDYCEKQDWIGLVFTPSAREAIQKLDSKLENGWLDNPKYKVPVKNKETVRNQTEELIAINLSKLGQIKQSIKCMAEQAKKQNPNGPEVKKYQNTLDFFDCCNK